MASSFSHGLVASRAFVLVAAGAFYSLAVQIEELVGSRGILPAARLFAIVRGRSDLGFWDWTERLELIVQGSHDGKLWETYESAYKPGRLDQTRFPLPFHLPRLDWQLWFAALRVSGGRRPAWLDALGREIRRESPAVLGLFATNPFLSRPPRYLRVRVYGYSFADWKNANYWKREFRGDIPLGQ